MGFTQVSHKGPPADVRWSAKAPVSELEITGIPRCLGGEVLFQLWLHGFVLRGPSPTPNLDQIEAGFLAWPHKCSTGTNPHSNIPKSTGASFKNSGGILFPFSSYSSCRWKWGNNTMTVPASVMVKHPNTYTQMVFQTPFCRLQPSDSIKVPRSLVGH